MTDDYVKRSWTDDEEVRLLSMWAEGISLLEIGRALRRSKNSVVGRAHRLKVKSRPSPIDRGNKGLGARKQKPIQPHRLPLDAKTLPPLPTAAPPGTEAQPAPANAGSIGDQSRDISAPSPPKALTTGATTVQPTAVPLAKVGVGCLFPMWSHNEKPTHRYCGQVVRAGKHYCPEHQDICYTKAGWLARAGRVSDAVAES